jgi:competence protein ComFB
MTKLTNYTEKLVVEELKKVLLNRKDICHCRTCQLDIMAYALNKLPPHYVASEGGHIHTMVNMSTSQLKVQVIAALVNAIDAVAKHPRHNKKKGLTTMSRR